MPSPKYGFCVISLLTGIYAEEWGERFGEPEVMDDFKESVFWTQQDRCIKELTTVVTAHTRLVATQAKQEPSTAEGR